MGILNVMLPSIFTVTNFQLLGDLKPCKPDLRTGTVVPTSQELKYA